MLAWTEFRRNTWQNASLLPKAVRVQVRDGATGRILSVSTSAAVHVDMPADCILAEVVDDCLKRERAEQSESASSGGAPRGSQ